MTPQDIAPRSNLTILNFSLHIYPWSKVFSGSGFEKGKDLPNIVLLERGRESQPLLLLLISTETAGGLRAQGPVKQRKYLKSRGEKILEFLKFLFTPANKSVTKLLGIMNHLLFPGSEGCLGDDDNALLL